MSGWSGLASGVEWRGASLLLATLSRLATRRVDPCRTASPGNRKESVMLNRNDFEHGNNAHTAGKHCANRHNRTNGSRSSMISGENNGTSTELNKENRGVEEDKKETQDRPTFQTRQNDRRVIIE